MYIRGDRGGPTGSRERGFRMQVCLCIVRRAEGLLLGTPPPPPPPPPPPSVLDDDDDDDDDDDVYLTNHVHRYGMEVVNTYIHNYVLPCDGVLRTETDFSPSYIDPLYRYLWRSSIQIFYIGMYVVRR